MAEFSTVLKEKPTAFPNSLEVGCEKRGIKGNNSCPCLSNWKDGAVISALRKTAGEALLQGRWGMMKSQCWTCHIELQLRRNVGHIMFKMFC